MPAPLHIDDLAENHSRSLVKNGNHYFVVKRDGQIYAYLNRCPHLGVELNWQEDQFLDSEGALIQCATHGALFLIEDGRCVSGPCLGEYLTPVDVSVEQGYIVVTGS